MGKLTYLALGDSLTAGVGDPSGEGFVGLYKERLHTVLKKEIQVHRKGRSGATSLDLYEWIRQEDVHPLIGPARIITISAGGNDLIQAAKRALWDGDDRHFTESLAACRRHVGEILAVIRQAKAGKPPYMIRLIGLYNPFPLLAEGRHWVNEFNRTLKGFTSKRIRMAEVYEAFLGNEQKLLAFDHVHPNPEGYKVMAEQLDVLGYSPLA
ncbi:GDSL-type esterase/lipase family protein [Paenibacillus aurantius]|uniref:GDSL-type esterase/lipase family protein n=1 Tax=Paenibacillus aurantius TaxID=2918900 RepID=A0AA96LB22_9BACL|nr:GDSL-type esterase/lipase family protein [Paenibacillus aurantius]WNQ09848.1 GDSL-type esterase/lipase family protein [Paenibacillus aurantius]